MIRSWHSTLQPPSKSSRPNDRPIRCKITSCLVARMPRKSRMCRRRSAPRRRATIRLYAGGAVIERQRRMAPRPPFRLHRSPRRACRRRDAAGTHDAGERRSVARPASGVQSSPDRGKLGSWRGRCGGRGALVSRSSACRRSRAAPRGDESSHGQTGLLPPATIPALPLLALHVKPFCDGA